RGHGNAHVDAFLLLLALRDPAGLDPGESGRARRAGRFLVGLPRRVPPRSRGGPALPARAMEDGTGRRGRRPARRGLSIPDGRSWTLPPSTSAPAPPRTGRWFPVTPDGSAGPRSRHGESRSQFLALPSGALAPGRRSSGSRPYRPS